MNKEQNALYHLFMIMSLRYEKTSDSILTQAGVFYIYEMNLEPLFKASQNRIIRIPIPIFYNNSMYQVIINEHKEGLIHSCYILAQNDFLVAATKNQRLNTEVKEFLSPHDFVHMIEQTIINIDGGDDSGSGDDPETPDSPSGIEKEELVSV